ncbi:type I-E CRISPR-associated protein Cse1/CasA [Streptomyces sp. NPDC044571]|uniref:type I-E CRISPR-associated protein Cse1/CasA n=1 Tax=Streptomyces sp. NPDC044571 TaxID=3155371 RepID=UPI0033E0FDE5
MCTLAEPSALAPAEAVHWWDPRVHPCIPVVTTGGRTESRTLLQVFRTADEDIRTLAGSTPGETVALFEFLLAICYASKSNPPVPGRWLAAVENRQPFDLAVKWLEDQPDDSWNLFHPTAPLGQNALLAPFMDEHGVGPAQLVIEHVGDYNQFFDHHHLEHPQPITAERAFRALLTQHAYGLSGRARISGKATLGDTITNLATGRLGARIRVIALGETLGDTLRLNLAPAARRGTFNHTWTVSSLPRRGFAAKPDGRPVDGPADLHTVLGRSILLSPCTLANGETGVDRVLVGAGELLAPLPDSLVQDVVYTGTGATAKPLAPSPARALWREAHALYAAVADRSKRLDLYHRLATLAEGRVSLWAVGLVANKTAPLTWLSDTFPYRPGREEDLRHAAHTGSQLAEYVAAALWKAAFAAWKVAYPNPKPADKKLQIARFDARPEHWAATEQPFHILLDTVVAGESVPASLEAYGTTLAEHATVFLEHRLDSLPANARGFQARADALRTLASEFGKQKAPDQLKPKEKRP